MYLERDRYRAREREGERETEAETETENGRGRERERQRERHRESERAGNPAHCSAGAARIGGAPGPHRCPTNPSNPCALTAAPSPGNGEGDD